MDLPVFELERKIRENVVRILNIYTKKMSNYWEAIRKLTGSEFIINELE